MQIVVRPIVKAVTDTDPGKVELRLWDTWFAQTLVISREDARTLLWDLECAVNDIADEF